MELVRFELETTAARSPSNSTSDRGSAGRGRGGVLRDAKLSLERALRDVRDAAAAALGQFQRMPSQPDQVEITFGVRLDAQAGAVIARTGVQGHLEVKLTWDRHSVAATTS